MSARQSTTERALRHLLRRAIRDRNWSFVETLFRELGTVWEEEAGAPAK